MRFIITKHLAFQDLLFQEWKITNRFNLKRKFTICERADLGVNLIFVKPFTSVKDLAHCKAALQNSELARIWLIKQGYGCWKKQSFLENGGNSRCYFYCKDKKNKKTEVFDKRRIPLTSRGNYITHPFSIDVKRPYFSNGKFVGVEGDFTYRKDTNETFAKAIEYRIQEAKKGFCPRAFLNKPTAKKLLQKLYLLLLHKLEG